MIRKLTVNIWKTCFTTSRNVLFTLWFYCHKYIYYPIANILHHFYVCFAWFCDLYQSRHNKCHGWTTWDRAIIDETITYTTYLSSAVFLSETQNNYNPFGDRSCRLENKFYHIIWRYLHFLAYFFRGSLPDECKNVFLNKSMYICREVVNIPRQRRPTLYRVFLNSRMVVRSEWSLHHDQLTITWSQYRCLAPVKCLGDVLNNSQKV